MNALDGCSAVRQSKGGRDYQKDDFVLLGGRDLGRIGREYALLLVADGMGGHVGGAEEREKFVAEMGREPSH